MTAYPLAYFRYISKISLAEKPFLPPQLVSSDEKNDCASVPSEPGGIVYTVFLLTFFVVGKDFFIFVTIEVESFIFGKAARF